MRTSNILLGLSLVLLYGCQPEAPAQQAAVPAAASEAAQVAPAQQAEPAPAEEAAQPAVAETPAQQTAAPAASEPAKTAPIQQAKPAPAEEAAQPTAAETPAQTDPAPVAAKVKPETPPEPVVSEADAMQLAKKNNCFACHAVGKKVVGPSFKDIAAKYRNNPDAETVMMERIAKGGSGVWGPMPMPPSPKVTAEERKELVDFVLGL